MKIKEERRKKRILLTVLKILLVLIALAVVCAILFFAVFVVEKVDIEDNVIYEDSAIEEMIFSDPKCHYSLYLLAKYNIFTQKDMPFIEDMEVKLVSPRHVSIVVYEKALIGYILNDDGLYYYFDSDGMVVEASDTLIEGTTQVIGLESENLVEGVTLQTEDEDVLTYLLDLTKLLEKYELCAETITVKNSSITILINQIEIKLGKNSHTEAKILRISEIIKSLEDESGTIDLSEWEKSSDDIVFQGDS
ncbi:MAG: cell division protein FtsQ/DivIB [Eubacterium sp.]|nr:cell division protein FtsQ/DivIB [Eubacterium sp.]